MSNKSWPEGQVAQDTLKSSKSVEGDISTTIYSWQESHKCSRNIPILAHRHATNFPGAGACLVYSTGKSLSEALIFASINPQYDNRLFMELPWKLQAQKMGITWETNLFPTELFQQYCDFIKTIAPFWYPEVSEHTCARFTHKQTLQLKGCKCGFTVSFLVSFCSIFHRKKPDKIHQNLHCGLAQECETIYIYCIKRIS